MGVLRRLSTWLRRRRAAPERADIRLPPVPDPIEWPEPWSSDARAYPIER